MRATLFLRCMMSRRPMCTINLGHMETNRAKASGGVVKLCWMSFRGPVATSQADLRETTRTGGAWAKAHVEEAAAHQELLSQRGSSCPRTPRWQCF